MISDGSDVDLLWRFVRGVPALVAVLDLDGRFARLNPAWKELLGWDERELLGQSFEGVVHPDDLGATRAIVATRFDGVTLGFENRLRHRDGSYRWFSWTSPDNVPPFSIAIGLDVTQVRRALDELATSREQLRSILRAAPGYVTIVDEELTIHYINRTYPGITVEQVVGTNLLNWLDSSHRESMEQAIRAVLAGKDVTPMVTIGSGADGGTTWYRTSFAPLRRGGVVTAVTMYGDDITAQMRAQRQRAQTSRFEATGRVALTVAHDVNNVLMAVQTAADVIAVTRDDATVRRELDALQTSVREAGALTNGLLAAFRGEPEPLDAPQLDLAETVRELADFVDRTAGRGIELLLRCGDAPVFAHVQPHEVSQILVNLVVNAREAMTAGGTIEVEVRTADLPPDGIGALAEGTYAVLTVSDDGPGIEPSIREHVFDPFFTTKPSGSGLGLATCYAVTKGRGGEMEIACPTGGGTQVRVWLPQARPGHAPRSSTAGPEPPPVPLQQGSGAPNALVVLLVGDGPFARATLGQHLSAVGYVVLPARDPSAAREVGARHPGEIDVLVVDTDAGGPDPRSFLTPLREYWPGISLLVLASDPWRPDDDGPALEGVKVLRKPIGPAAVVRAIREVAGDLGPGAVRTT